MTFLWAVLIAGFSFYFDVDWAPNLNDEGFLWYGALKTLEGQVPLLDFQSYFPARYYVIAAFFKVFGPDLITMRLAAAASQVAALFLAFRIARRVSDAKLALLLLGFLMTPWMTVPCRYFDAAVVIACVFFGMRLLEKATVKRHCVAGIFTGVALCFGINHGWYASVIFQTLVLLNAFKTGRKNFLVNELSFLAGIGVGCLPLAVMAASLPGFGKALVEYFALTLSRRNDIQMPWPLPMTWGEVSSKFPMTHQRLLEFVHKNSLAVAFPLVPAFYIGLLVLVLRRSKNRWRSDALYAACAVVGTVYLHHFSRCVNLVYLGEAMAPFLIAVWALAMKSPPQKTRRRSLIAVLVVLTFLGPGLISNAWYRLFLPEGALARVEIGAHRFWAKSDEKREIDSVRQCLERNLRADETFFTAPLSPMYYCLLNRPSPVHQLCFIFPEPEKNQLKMIRDLKEKKVRWAVVGDVFMEEYPELHFSKTHSLVWQYLKDEFDPYLAEGFPAGHYLWKRRKEF